MFAYKKYSNEITVKKYSNEITVEKIQIQQREVDSRKQNFIWNQKIINYSI